jgi:hypothetical protein
VVAKAYWLTVAHEEQHLGELTPILVLSNALVGAPGHDPAHGPSEVWSIRIPVAAISAWCRGTHSADAT